MDSRKHTAAERWRRADANAVPTPPPGTACYRCGSKTGPWGYVSVGDFGAWAFCRSCLRSPSDAKRTIRTTQ